MLGGIGACLTLLGAVSTVVALVRYAYPISASANFVFSLISGIVGLMTFTGFILFFIAMYGFSKDYGTHRIFDYILYGLIITIVVAVISGILMVAGFFANLTSIIPNLASPPTSQQIESSMLSFAAPFLAVFGFITLINVVFEVLAFNLLAVKSQVHLFRTSAKLLLAGGVLQIAIGIIFAIWASSGSASINTLTLIAVPSGLVQYTAWALLAVAFFRIPAFNAYHTAIGQIKRCPYCGAQNSIDAVYCMQCGKKQ